MADQTFEEYVDLVADRLDDRGFEPYPESPEGYRVETFHRRSPSLSKLGLVDVFCVLGSFADPAIRTVEAFADRAFDFALDHRLSVPRGLGARVVVYPVAVCETAADRLMGQLTGYSPTHWGAWNFLVAVDRSTERVSYYTGTPTLGGRHYEGFRRFADEVLDPHEVDADLDPRG